ncbi:hypothetical protein GOP47_0003800 [Adiantum capillus-veneris]|uniref:EF-hand domain-containing protein n=1 Tax=Adiantum capillus-veneris TaxID=13818 RepID=A0A9D4ZNW9_ADICA|nr:hypothetical protein GOP47_0003800 [Adiantum capillus-veneris]
MTRTKATVKRRQQRRRLEREAEKAEAQVAELQPQDACEEARQSTDIKDVVGVEEDRVPPAEPANVEGAFKYKERSEDKEMEENDEEDEEGEEADNASENDGEGGLLTDYEKQKEQRLKENAAKLASLNLPLLASSLGPSRRSQRQASSSKRKRDDDYVPSSSSDSQDSDDYETSDDYGPKDAVPQVQQENHGEFDEDQALEKAIELSLQTPADNVTDTRRKVPRTQRNKRQVCDKKGTAKRRRKGAQGQFTVEEIAAVFAIIDEQGNGKFSVAELERVVRSHDFTWSKQEIADMIDIFDSNKDGQLDLPEFQSIFGRMNMLRMHVT